MVAYVVWAINFKSDFRFDLRGCLEVILALNLHWSVHWSDLGPLISAFHWSVHSTDLGPLISALHWSVCCSDLGPLISALPWAGHYFSKIPQKYLQKSSRISPKIIINHPKIKFSISLHVSRRSIRSEPCLHILHILFISPNLSYRMEVRSFFLFNQIQLFSFLKISKF